MKISRNWLQRYVDLAERSDEDLAYALTMLGFEVESIAHTGLPPLAQVVVGEILAFARHPDADKLSVCEVDVGDGRMRRIVCGAKNFQAGDRVLVALPGAVLPGDFKIKEGKLRGVVSEGMMCSERELGLGDDHAGIAILAQRPDLGTPVNAVYADSSDTVFDLEITPNRPDALSHVGIARELAAWFKLELRYPEVKVNPSAVAHGHLVESLEVTEAERCPHYLGFSLRGVRVAPSPGWLREAIQAIGLRPINNVVDVTNYVLHELGQPLHAFDVKKIGGRRIVVRPAREGETIVTLDEKERALDGGMTVIADADKALVVAGVMGSVDAEVDETTTDLFLESAWFSPPVTRRTSRALGLSTDSSYRFERGVDPHGQLFAALRCIDLILETAGGELMGPPLVSGEPPLTRSEIDLRPAFVRERLGFEISDEVIAESLRALECDVLETTDDDEEALLRVGVPSWRLDLDRPIDLVEEVIRVYGCDQIPEGEVRARGLLAEDDPVPVFLREASVRLVGKGFNEAMHYSLRDEAEVAAWFPGESSPALALQNPLAADASHLRPSLLPGLLDCARLNQARHNEPRALFETGRVFRGLNGSTTELVSVAFVLLRKTAASWKASEEADFFSASQLLAELAAVAGVKVDPADFEALAGDPLWQEGHAARWGDLRRGYEGQLGLLSPRLTRAWDLDGLVVAGSLVFTAKFLQREKKRRKYSAFSGYPPAGRDLALLVDAAEPSGKVRRAVEKFARETCPKDFGVEETRVFDVYLGEGLPEGKKSIAFHLRYRAAERTLKDAEVNAAFESLQARLQAKTAYAVRG
jgi:phenylalanyl-tRNA synthetase beta chain